MPTMQDLIDLARRPLNDDAKTTWKDEELLAYANHGLRLLKVKRPDFFWGSYATPFTDLAFVDNFPAADIAYPAIVDFVTAKAQFKDAEEAVRTSAAAFFEMAQGALG